MIEPRLKKLEAMAGLPKTLFAFSIPMTSAASETRRMNGNMIRVSEAVQLRLDDIEARSEQRDQLAREHHADGADAAEHDHGQRRHLVRQPPGGSVALARDGLAECGDEGGRQRPLGEQIAQQVWNAKGHRECIHRAEPPPNKAAQICSRNKPSTRLHITARPMMPAALVLRRSVRVSGAMTSAATSEGSGCKCGLELELMK